MNQAVRTVRDILLQNSISYLITGPFANVMYGHKLVVSTATFLINEKEKEKLFLQTKFKNCDQPFLMGDRKNIRIFFRFTHRSDILKNPNVSKEGFNIISLPNLINQYFEEYIQTKDPLFIVY